MKSKTKPETIKSNTPSPVKDLILLFAIPISIAVFAALVVYVPRLFANPQHDFIYSTCDDYQCDDSFKISADGRIIKTIQRTTGTNVFNKTSELRYYDVENDASRSLTLSEAERYTVLDSSKSPDGYSLSRDNSNGGFLFWGDYKDGWHLKNGAKKKSVSLYETDRSYYSNDVELIGWVTK